MKFRLLLILLSSTSVACATNVLEQGDFAAGVAGGPPPEPWITGKPKPEVKVILENPPGAADGGNWVRLVDDSAQDAAGIVQKFPEMTSGRLRFRLHVVKSGAAIWFLLGRKELGGRGDAVFGFKITSSGQLLVAQDGQKIANSTGGKSSFPGGQTYDLYCDFKNTGSSLEIEIGQKDGEVLFRGTSATAAPISAFGIRTHGEETGSDFYLTDLALELLP